MAKTIRTPTGTFELAGFGVRLGGYLIDVVVWWVVYFALAAVGAAMVVASAGDGYEAATLFQILSLVGPFAAQWTFNAIGWSPGKRAVGLRIIKDHGGPPGAGAGLGRTLGAWLSLLALGLGYLWAAWDGKNQTWHDKMASTYVVRV